MAYNERPPPVDTEAVGKTLYYHMVGAGVGGRWGKKQTGLE